MYHALAGSAGDENLRDGDQVENVRLHVRVRMRGRKREEGGERQRTPRIRQLGVKKQNWRTRERDSETG